ncbi:MAG: universal stress protein [Alphaproteobacteria bacterium]|nr:universal stress protein [Alphaproteobacteria bacterium]
MAGEAQDQLRSLLVALDDTPASTGAQQLALQLAQAHKAALTGATILDIDYLTAPQPAAIGTAAFKLQADLARVQRGRERNERLIDRFQVLCRSENVSPHMIALEGRPAEQLGAAAVEHDLVVVARDSDFHGDVADAPAPVVERMVKTCPRPLIIVPQAARLPKQILIAFDASAPAARALQLFVLLGMARGAEVHVIAVAPHQDEAERRTRHAAAYLRLHGIVCRPAPIASASDPADVVDTHARSIGADLVVMGAFGHRGWRETLLGSFTTHLLSDCPTALFVHH